jgi:YD repeat-containing protein
VVTTYKYNSLNRLTDEVVSESSGTSVATYSYTLDNAGNRTGVTETQLLPNGTVNTRIVVYQYDNLYRLLSEAISGDSQGANGTVTYTYDLTGNRMSRTSNVAGVSTSTSKYPGAPGMPTVIPPKRRTERPQRPSHTIPRTG